MKKIAVIVIHGIGEQRPMDTLRGFVKAAWETDVDLHHERAKTNVYSKPDELSNNFELRRLSTSRDVNNHRTDFFEFYWAHLMDGTKVGHVYSWVKRILGTPPWKLPRPLGKVWCLFLIFILFVLGIFYAIYQFNEIFDSTPFQWLLSLMSLIIIPMMIAAIENVLGDAARYLDPSPKNVIRRQEIRQAGVQLLRKLHDTKKYERIIIVGHSLGSVIAYDIITHAWPTYGTTIAKGTQLPALKKMTDYLDDEHKEITSSEYRPLQQAVFAEQKEKGSTWRVSDLITLGSPLTYANLLLAKNKEDLTLKVAQRELPTCPPQLDSKKLDYIKKKKIAESDQRESVRQLYYAAPFAPTRWTNIYAPTKGLIFGDIVSGPLGHLFGQGIKDIPVSIPKNGGLFSHTHYWSFKDPKEEQLVALREALDLLGKGE